MALSAVAFPVRAQAQTNSWVNAGSGAWEDSGNWSLAQAPASTHSILITNDNTKTVQINSVTSGSFSNTMTVTNLILSAPSGATNTLALSASGTNRPLHILDSLGITAGGALLMTNSSLLVDGVAGGAFSLDGCASLSSTNGISGDLYVGFSTNSSGSVNLVDGQTLLTNGYTAIGFYGSGQVVLSNGTLKIADILGGTNDILANGVFLGLTSGSAGDLTIAGGKYDASELLSLGDEGGSTGSVWISDGQLIIGTNDYLMTIGNNGAGQLILSNGQLVASYVIVAGGQGSQGALLIAGGTATFSRALSVGVGQGATGIVSITGGQLQVTNHNAIVGDYGIGQMTVSNGAFRARTIVVGHNNGSQGTLTISGGITSVASNLVAGAYSNATGVIQVTGGELNVTNQSGTCRLVVGQIGSGVFTQGGGTLIVDQLLATNGTNSILNFGSGTVNTKSTTVSNTQTFIVGDGFGSATYHLLGGVHSFANDLRIRTNAFLIGCGTINGNVVVDAGGTVLADCGGTLTFTGSVTNNGVMKAVNGSTLESYGAVVNNGLINVLSGNTNFHAAFINNGLVLSVDSIPQIVSIRTVGDDVEIRFTTSAGATYIPEYRTNMASGSWIPFPSIVALGGTTSMIDLGAALLPQKFYRIRLEVPE
ncbi:MAG TPA: hypothetical protein VNL17_12850 [Verrucomicrobiae bacterium]|nr:hypothetical protein [Verrucomicrobiae bacterium]